MIIGTMTPARRGWTFSLNVCSLSQSGLSAGLHAFSAAFYDLLFRTSSETLLEVARNPLRLGAEIGFFSVLHTWSQKLAIHPHVHCVVPAGGLSLDHTRWVRSQKNYFLPKEVLQEVFRGKFHEALKQAFHDV
jgi:hypothetical protein